MKLAKEIAVVADRYHYLKQKERRDGVEAAITAKLEPVRNACQKMVRYADGTFDEQEIGDAGDMFAEAMVAIRAVLAELSEE